MVEFAAPSEQPTRPPTAIVKTKGRVIHVASTESGTCDVLLHGLVLVLDVETVRRVAEEMALTVLRDAAAPIADLPQEQTDPPAVDDVPVIDRWADDGGAAK